MFKKRILSQKWITLIIVISMTFMACLDASIINVALPVLTKELGEPLSTVQWVVISYLMTICCTLIFWGRLGDVHGKSFIFKFGMGMFIVGSLLCALSPNLKWLVLSRIVQAVGAGAFMANNQGIITQIFGAHERGKALGILGSSVALGTMAGPAIGGIILSVMSWNYIFFVNIPIGIIAFVFSIKYLPKKHSNGEKIDYIGAVLLFVGVLLLFGPLAAQAALSLSLKIIVPSILIGILLIYIFIIFENKQAQPLLKLDLFKMPLFSISLFCGFTSFICLNASIILIPFYLENSLKISAANTGFLMMISPIIVAILSPFAGKLSDRIGSEIISMFGLFILSLSFFLMGFLTEYSSIFMFIIFVSIMAIGQGFFQPSNNSLIMSCPPPTQLGVAGSINSLIRNLGLMAGVTICTSLLYSFMSMHYGSPVTDYIAGRDDVFIYGMKRIYWILGFICLIGAIVSAMRFRIKDNLSINSYS